MFFMNGDILNLEHACTHTKQEIIFWKSFSWKKIHSWFWKEPSIYNSDALDSKASLKPNEKKRQQKEHSNFWSLALRNHWKGLRRKYFSSDITFTSYLVLNFWVLKIFFFNIYKAFKMLLWWYYMHNLRRATDVHRGRFMLMYDKTNTIL